MDSCETAYRALKVALIRQACFDKLNTGSTAMQVLFKGHSPLPLLNKSFSVRPLVCL